MSWTPDRLYRVRCKWQRCVANVYGGDEVINFYFPDDSPQKLGMNPVCRDELYHLEQWYTVEVNKLGRVQYLDYDKLVKSMIEDIAGMDWSVKSDETHPKNP